MSRSWAKGSTRRWRRLRAAILLANQAENKGQCRLQIPTVCTGTATQVHHTMGKAHGDDPRHLIAACAQCNQHVGSPTKNSPQLRPVTRW